MHKHKKTEAAAHHASGDSASVQQPAAASDSAAQGHNGKTASEEIIRLRAYEKWEVAGKPTGDGVKYWLEAEQEVLQAK